MFNKKLLSVFIIGAIIGLAVWVGVRNTDILLSIRLKPDSPFNASATPAAPDYVQNSSWAVLPTLPSSADERPAGEATADPRRRASVDVFFIHPTSLLSDEAWNDRIDRDDSVLRQGILRVQAGVFNRCCHIYAPRYRQATLWSFIGDEPDTYKALEFAYSDVRRAFKEFLRRSKNRPFILAGHSQGSLHAMRLLQEEIAPRRNIAARMVVAYMVGYAIPDQMPTGNIKPCAAVNSMRCYINWNSVGDDYEDDFWVESGRIWFDGGWQAIGGKKLTCVNPLSWRLNGGLVSHAFHKGGLVPDDWEAKIMPPLTPKLVSARCSENGLLYISEPVKSYQSALVNNDDFHIVDYHLFYANIRENIDARIKAFFKNSSRY